MTASAASAGADPAAGTSQQAAEAVAEAVPGTGDTAAGTTQQVVEEFASAMFIERDFQKATANFDATMTSVMPPEKCRAIVESLESKCGNWKGFIGTRTATRKPFTAIFVSCQFEKTILDMKTVCNVQNQITGLWFLPGTSPEPYTPPGYVRQEAFFEEEVVTGTGTWRLPGTLSVPEGKGPFPAVVLVHGSGPQDRDETLGPNKPFRDLAWGLASSGIAVLRYEKRTRALPGQCKALIGSLTVKEETVDDACAAVEFLMARPCIKKNSIYVLGHSLGAVVIPRIARSGSGIAGTGIAGFISMAGTARPLEDVILDQFTYISSLDGEISEEEQQYLDAVKTQVLKVKDPDLSTDVPAAELPLGVPPAYWLDLREYDPAAEAARISQPIFFLQGERDYQATTEDFDLWKKGISSRPNAEFKLYPGLNHLFMPGEGPCTPQEYQKAGHVARIVIKDIAGWILKQENR